MGEAIHNDKTDAAEALSPVERAAVGVGFLSILAGIIGIVVMVLALSGCVYKGGRVVDGTNLEIGMTIPGTEWSINFLSYTGGMKVCGNDGTAISVTNRVSETNTYFGVVRTERTTEMSARIEPTIEPEEPKTENDAEETNY